MIRRKSQLATLVRRIEDSQLQSAQAHNHGLGWLITHVKLLATVYDNDWSVRTTDNSNNPLSLQQRADRGRAKYVNPEHDSTANLLRRLLLCCPRLEVFLDAAPYAFDEHPRPVLTEIGSAPLLHPPFSPSAVARRWPTPVGAPSHEGDSHAEESPFSSVAEGDDYPPESTDERSRIRSIEWGYGSPSISDLLIYPPSSATASIASKRRRAALGNVTRSVRALRCNALSDPNWVFSTAQGTLRPNPAIQYDPYLMEWASELSLSRRARSLNDERPMLWMPRLVLLDMFLSARSHTHWATLVAASSTTIALTTPSSSSSSSSSATSPTSRAPGSTAPTTSPSSVNGLPSLTHLTIRTPSSMGAVVGSEAIASLHVFLKAYGPQLKSLDLRVSPGDVESNVQPLVPPHDGIPMHPGAENGNEGNGEQDPVAGMLNISLILARCPNLEELALSARWPSPHSFTSPSTTTAAGNAQPPPPNDNTNENRNRNANMGRQHPSPFAIPFNDNLRRIGLRDTTPHADGFSPTLASGPCPSCRRVYMLSSASELVFGCFMGGGSGSGSGAGVRHDTGTETVSAQMPYRPRASLSPSGPSATLATTQHPFPSTLVESLLNGALLSNAYSLHESFPSSSSPIVSRNGSGTGGQHIKSGGMGGLMSHRHCTIDRHFRMMLSGVVPLDEPEPYLCPFVRDVRRDAVADMLAAADAQPGGGVAGGVGHGQNQAEEDILRRIFGTTPRFPKLETIQLLDSQPRMFSNAKPRSSSARTASPPAALTKPTTTQAQAGIGVPHHVTPSGTDVHPIDSCGSNDNDHDNEASNAMTACSTTCWCIPLEGRVEMNFWGAWAARCEARGIKLLDRAGKRVVPVYADCPTSPAAPLPITGSAAAVHTSSWTSSTTLLSTLSPSLSPLSLTSTSPSLSAHRGPAKLENMDLEDELNLSIVRAALLRNPRSRGLTVSGLCPSAPIRRLTNLCATASALVSLTLGSKGPSDMSFHEVAQRLILWFAEHGMISITSE